MLRFLVKCCLGVFQGSISNFYMIPLQLDDPISSTDRTLWPSTSGLAASQRNPGHLTLPAPLKLYVCPSVLMQDAAHRQRNNSQTLNDIDSLWQKPLEGKKKF